MARVNQKLATKYCGRFPVSTGAGNVAYRLWLPPCSKIYSVFHISQLRKHIGNKPYQCILPESGDQGYIIAELLALLDANLSKEGNPVVVFVLSEWSNVTKKMQHGCSILTLKCNFHCLVFQLEDKPFCGREVTINGNVLSTWSSTWSSCVNWLVSCRIYQSLLAWRDALLVNSFGACGSLNTRCRRVVIIDFELIQKKSFVPSVSFLSISDLWFSGKFCHRPALF